MIFLRHVVEAERVWGIGFDRSCGANVIGEVGARLVGRTVAPREEDIVLAAACSEFPLSFGGETRTSPSTECCGDVPIDVHGGVIGLCVELTGIRPMLKVVAVVEIRWELLGLPKGIDPQERFELRIGD